MVLISWIFFSISPKSFAVSIVRIVHGKHVIHRSHPLLMCSERTIAREEKCFKTENNRNIPENKTIKWTRSLSIVQNQSRNYNTQHWRLFSKLGMNAVWFTFPKEQNTFYFYSLLFWHLNVTKQVSVSFNHLLNARSIFLEFRSRKYLVIFQI